MKEPLTLTAVDGLTQAETAAVPGISEKAVEVRIDGARKALAASLAMAPSSTKMPQATA